MSMSIKRISSWLVVAVWAGLIFFMSAHTGDDLNEGSDIFTAVFQVLDDWQTCVLGEDADFISLVAHCLEYAVLGLLLANALRHDVSMGYACLLAVLFASLYGIADELHQLFVPGRLADPADWLIDTCGAALGSFSFHLKLCGVFDLETWRRL